MKAKNILMSILLVTGFIAAKADTGYPPELALVSQPVLVYNYNSITVNYDVQNIGDKSYKGHIYIYLDPDDGYAYADRYVKVCPGKIKRVSIDIPAYRLDPDETYTVMPYYKLNDNLFSFTTFEYFDPLSFYWDGPRNETWVVTVLPPLPRIYVRPGDFRYYYDGFRPPMPPPPGPGHGPGTPPPPLDPMHHTYDYHHHNGYPPHPNGNNNPPHPGGNGNPPHPGGNDNPPHPGGNDNPPHPNNGGGGNGHNDGGASVRPNPDGGSMSHGNANNGGNNNGGNTPPPNNNDGSHNGSNSGRTGNSGNVNRPNNNSGTSGSVSGSGTNSNSGRTGNSGNVSRPSNNGARNARGAGAGARGGGRAGRGRR